MKIKVLHDKTFYCIAKLTGDCLFGFEQKNIPSGVYQKIKETIVMFPHKGSLGPWSWKEIDGKEAMLETLETVHFQIKCPRCRIEGVYEAEKHIEAKCNNCGHDLTEFFEQRDEKIALGIALDIMLINTEEWESNYEEIVYDGVSYIISDDVDMLTLRATKEYFDNHSLRDVEEIIPDIEDQIFNALADDDDARADQLAIDGEEYCITLGNGDFYIYKQ